MIIDWSQTQTPLFLGRGNIWTAAVSAGEEAFAIQGKLLSLGTRSNLKLPQRENIVLRRHTLKLPPRWNQ